MPSIAEWIELTLPVEPAAVDGVAHHLLELGSPGLQIGDAVLVAYFPAVDSQRRLAELERRLRDVRAVFGPVSVGAPSLRVIHDQDWAEDWKAHYRPLVVGRRVWIGPAWLRGQAHPPAGRVPLWMEPGMAFGTGEHASTQLALVLLELALDRRDTAPAPEFTVLDVGTGSGILALAAALLGAGRVMAYDLDELAVRVARENVRSNGLAAKVNVASGDLYRLPEVRADVAVANILFQPLREAAPGLVARVVPGGSLILSGITVRQREPLRQAYERQGCLLHASVATAGWAALWLERG